MKVGGSRNVYVHSVQSASPITSLFLCKTFFDLRDKLRSVKVKVYSVKLHHDELETDGRKVFDYVSQKCSYYNNL